MKKSTFKRVLAAILCIAVLIAGMPLALMNVSAASNVIFDDFEGEVNWIRDDSTSVDSTRIDVQSATNSNKVFRPISSANVDLGNISSYTYAGALPDSKLVSVSGTFQTTSANTLVLVYWYKDANNWRGISIGTGGQWYRIVGKQTLADGRVAYSNFFAYGNYTSEGGTITSNTGLLGSEVSFEITYAEDGKASIVFSKTVEGVEQTSNAIALNTAAKNHGTSNLLVSEDGGATFSAATANVNFPAITANEGKFGLGTNKSAAYSWVDNIVMTHEATPADEAQAFKITHAEILAKDVDSVTADDLVAINAALADYDALSDKAKALLTAEKTLLSAMAKKIVGAAFNVQTFTDDFSGDNNWEQVGFTTSTASPIVDGVFQPSASKDANGLTSIHTHKYWPEKKLSTVSGKYKLHDTYAATSSMIVYYYKDANNWRGVYFQRAGAMNGRYIMKESDPEDPSKVYFLSTGNVNDIGFPTVDSVAPPVHGTVADFTLTYGGDNSVELTLSNAEYSATKALSTGEYSGTGYVSTDGGETFTAATEAHTFAALTDVQSGQFAMGNGVGTSYFDDITVAFERDPQEIADEFLAAHAEILAKNVDDVAVSDEAAIKAALEELEGLSSGAKALLTEEKELLLSLEQKVIVEKFNADSFTDDFEGDNNWVQVGSGAEGTIVDGEYYPAASTNLTGNISIHTHKYWPNNRKIENVSGSYRTAALSSLMIYYYKDANNWRGFYSHNGSNRHVRFVMKATDAATGDVYFWYSTKNDIESITSVTNNPMAFELIYENDTTIKLKVNGQEREDVISGAKTSHDGQTFVSTDGGQSFTAMSGTYTFPAITDAKSAKFAMGNGQNNSRFDNLTFNFSAPYDPSVSEEFEEFEATYTKTTATVTYEDAAKINEALTLYETLTDDQKANYAEEKAALDAIKAVAEFDKEIREIAITPANINTAAEKQAEYQALNIDNASIESAIANIEATVNTFRATVQGGTIKGDANPTKQDLRFEYKAPTGSVDGWYVKAYGALFIPESILGNAKLDINNQIASGDQVDLQQGENVPETFYANLTNSAIQQLRCETNIAGTAYVIWTNGTDEYVYYCNNEVNNDGYTENETADGIGVRSVYGIARKIAKAIYGTTEYGTVNYTENVTAGGDVATFADADVLEFVAANVEVITNYVEAKQ